MFSKANFAGKLGGAIATPASLLDPVNQIPDNVCYICRKKSTCICARCGAVAYCSKTCQREHWGQENGHKTRCNKKNPLSNPYVYVPAEINYQTLRFRVVDFQAGPDQPIDPPAGEDYDFARELWKEREFLLNGEVMFMASFVEPECKKMVQDALLAKRVTWPLLMNSCFIFKLTQASMPLDNLRIVIRHLIQEEVKQNASAKCDNIIEHFFRVRGLPGQKEYNPVFAKLLQKHKLSLPLTCDGHDLDDLRDYTHYRLSHPGYCKCYHCQAKQYEWLKNKEVWERVRLRSAKKGIFLMSWDMKVEIEEREYDKVLWAIDTSPTGQKPTAKDWVYAPDQQREVTNQSLGDLVTLMKVVDKASKEKRMLTMTEMDVIMKSISISKDAYAAEEVRAVKAAKDDADLAAQRARKNRVSAAAAAKSRDRIAVAEQRGRGVMVAREAAAKGKDRRRTKIAEGLAATRKAQATGEGMGSRPKRAAAKAVSYADDSSDDADDEDEEGGGRRRRSRGSGKSSATATADDDSASLASGDEGGGGGGGGSDSDSLDLSTTDDDEDDDDSLNLDSSSDAGGSGSRRRRRRGRGSNGTGKASHNRKSGGGRKKKSGSGGGAAVGADGLTSQQRTKAKVEAGLNPLGLTRTVAQGPREGESIYDHRKNMLLAHQEVVGNMMPKYLYRIPWDDRFPPHMWGENLGKVVSMIRSEGLHADKREELEALGFDYGKQANPGNGKALGWEVVKACLEQYKTANPETTKKKGWIVPQDFKVPDGDAAWPEKAWGKGLGKTVDNIRHCNAYKEHRAAILALGITYPPGK